MALTVLMVEDNDGDAYLFREYLDGGETRCRVSRVDLLSDALDLLGKNRFDAILLDLNLPDSAGLETLTTVRAVDKNTPIVLLTGLSDEEMAMSCLREGAQDYLVKNGVTSELLSRTVNYSIERMRIERALKKSEAEFFALYEHAPYGIYRSDAEGNLLDVNEAVCSMLRCDTKTEAMSLNLARDVYAEPAEHARQVARRLEDSEFLPEEAVWQRRDGSQITVRLTGRTVLDENGSFNCFEMFAEDITNRLVMERQLRQTQKMEAVGQLAGGVAHEINNLLSIILADTELIQRSLPAGHEDLVDDMEEVRQVAIRGGKLVKRLLGFSRKQRLAVEVVELDKFVAETVEMLRRLVPEFVKIQFEPEGDQGRISIDPATVEQILLNLTTNARDAMPDGGDLTISTGTTMLDSEFCKHNRGARPGPSVFLKVSDTGAGMDEETREHVFEPFFTTKSAEKGTGLGLSTVYGLVKQQSGYITIESNPGRGTTIQIYFPSVDAPSTPRRRDSGPVLELEGQETVLLVEDEAELRRAAEKALKKFGYKVLLATDGNEGLENYRNHSEDIDVVLSDVVMPNKGGPAFVQELLDEADGNAPAIVFMSGYTSGDLRGADLLDGRFTVLEKPWELQKLLSTVRGALDKKTGNRSAPPCDPLAGFEQ